MQYTILASVRHIEIVTKLSDEPTTPTVGLHLEATFLICVHAKNLYSLQDLYVNKLIASEASQIPMQWCIEWLSSQDQVQHVALLSYSG